MEVQKDMNIKKKILSLLLLAALVIGMVPATAFAADAVTVSNQKLAINSQAVDVFASYNINGENYLKIRDVALLLKDTPANFSADYANGVVTIKTNTAYTPDGSESKAKPAAYNAFDVSADKVSIDGKNVDFKVYKIDGSNYFRLRDFTAIGAIIGYDSATSTAQLTTVPTASTTILVHAAASLDSVFKQVISDFNEQYPNIKIDVNAGGSGALVTQIQQGAGGDLFFSADKANMDKVADDIVTATRKDLLKNSLVLIVPAANPKNVTSFEDVVDKAGKDVVAIGEAKTVPAGDRAREVYESLGLTSKLEALTLTLDDSVTKVRNHVSSGDAVAGFVYATDAAGVKEVKVIATAAESSHAPIVYPGAVLKDSKNQDAAKAFLAYLGTDAAAARFKAAGFTIVQ
jgi:molybdate transport system substrate-binding protein